MRVDLEKILFHANESLSFAETGSEREEQVQVFKRFLKIETERLKNRHRFGLGGGEIAGGRSYAVDLIICRACQLAASELFQHNPEMSNCAVAALGGYGRKELAPQSDVDILFLHAGRQSRDVKPFVEQVLYLLWDMGLTVGHSFRSVSECVAMADDLHSRNAMSEARLITGNAHLFRRFTREMDEAVFNRRPQTEAFLEQMRLERDGRYARFGAAVCMQEPNVKESAGGLRDLHTVLWVGRAVYGAKGLDDLRAQDHISGAEYSSMRRAYDFISRVRNEAHFTTGRMADLLTLDLQPELAANLGYKPRRGLLASEIFMRDYYRRAHELHRACESILAQAYSSWTTKRRSSSRARQIRASFELRRGQYYLTIKEGPPPDSLAASFEIKQGRLYLKQEPADFHSNPMRLLEIFSVAQAEGVDLSDELKIIIRGNLHPVGRGFRASEEAGRAFVEILRHKGRVAATLRAMHETGFLGQFLPEFGRITFLVQHDLYHKYTIDEHTLTALESLDRTAAGDDAELARFGKIFAEVRDVAALYLGVLFHDIGKGHGPGHVQRGTRIAERVCKRLRLDQESEREVVFLVRHHLLMSHLSQRRDLSDEGLIEAFVATVGNLNCLNLLMLLTYADINGVGPGVWNDWKSALLWELYALARSHFAEDKPVRWDRNRRTLVKQQVMRELLPEYLPSEVERHFVMLPERYLRATRVNKIASHFRLLKRMAGDSFIADWRLNKHFTELTICTRDATGLFANIAGTLTAHGINILSADLYTREDGIVIDTFKVSSVGGHQPVRAEKWLAVETNLRAALKGDYNVAEAVERWRARAPRPFKRHKRHIAVKPAVRFDLSASASDTVIEIRAEDEPGLAYKIASTIAALGFSITFAKIATEKSLALDVFYITDSTGGKLTQADMQQVERALLDALGGGMNPNKEAL